MAKLHGAAKAKFLARMARGRKKHSRRTKRTNPRRAKARRNPLYARHGIDRNERIYPSMVKRTPNPRKRKRARKSNRKRSRARRKNPIAYLVNPTGGTMARKRRKSRKTRKHNARRPRHTKRRRNPFARRRRHARRRNPGIGNVMGMVKGSIMPAAGAAAGGFVGGFVEARLSGKSAIVSKLGQIAVGIAGGAIASKIAKSSAVGLGFLGGVIGGLTRPMGERAGGGVTGTAALERLASLQANEENLGLLLNEGAGMRGGLGLLMPGSGNMSGLGDGALMDALHEDGAR
jgi:hypothetical protein